jgi:hypothetical protein
MAASPSEEYASRLAARESQVAQLKKLHVRIGNVRLVLAVETAVVGWWCLERHTLSPWLLLGPVVGFTLAAVYHSKVLREQSRAQRAIDFYRAGEARIQDCWAGTGQDGKRFELSHHVYAADLELFGKGSLFELLSIARTRMGEDALAKWLLSPSSINEIRERHAAVLEIRDRVDFREELAILGEGPKAGVQPDALLKWANAPNRLSQLWLQWVALFLAVLAVGTVVVWAVSGMATPFLVVVVA